MAVDIRALQIGEISATDLSRGLRKILASGIQVPELQQYAQLALDSHEPALRELAVEQIGRTIQVRSFFIQNTLCALEVLSFFLHA